MIIHIGGAKGVGKSTVVSKLKETDPTLTVMAVSERLMSVARNILGKEWKDANDEQRALARRTLCGEIRSLPGTVILDSHYIDMVDGSPKIVFPRELLRDVGVFVIMTCSPAEILRRRTTDNNRNRSQSLEEIAEEMEAERIVADELSRQNGTSPCITITNSEVGQTVVEMQGLIRNREGGRDEFTLRHRER